MIGERDDEELKILYLSINVEEAEVNVRKKWIGHRIENQTCRGLKYLHKKIKYHRLQIKRFGMNSITEYYTFGIKVRQSIFLQLVCTYLTISNNPETSIACYYSFFFLQQCAIFFDGFIIQRVFIKSLTQQLGYSRGFIKATKTYRTESNHLSTTKFFFEKSRCPLIEFPMLLTTVSGGKL